MSTFDEAEAERWCIDNGFMEDPFKWSSWVKQPFTLKIHRSVAGGLLFGGNIYKRRKKIRKDHRMEWIYEYATKKEAFVQMLGKD